MKRVREALVVFTFFGATAAFSKPSFPLTKDGIAKRELSRVLLGEPIPLPQAEKSGCRFPDSKSAAEMLVVILGNLSAAESTREKELKVKCEPDKTKNIACSISVHISADQKSDPYTCGLSYVVDHSNQKIDPTTIRCPGTC